MPIKPNTKQILADSFEELLERQSFSKTTVQDIVDNCGASRTAFYRHFKDKFDLMNWIYKHHVDEKFRKFSFVEYEHWKVLMLDIMTLFYEKQRYYETIIEYKSQNSFLDFYYQYTVQGGIRMVQQSSKSEEVSDNILFSIKLYSSGIVFMVSEWIAEGFKLTPAQMSQLLCDNIPKPLYGYLPE